LQAHNRNLSDEMKKRVDWFESYASQKNVLLLGLMNFINVLVVGIGHWETGGKTLQHLTPSKRQQEELEK